MTGTYDGTDGVYTGRDGVYAVSDPEPKIAPQIYDDFNWGGPLGDRYTLRGPTHGEIITYPSNTSNQNYLSDYRDSANLWSNPGDGLNTYPQPGDEVAYVFRVDRMLPNYRWFLSFQFGGLGNDRGTNRWNRWMLRFINNDDDGIRFTLSVGGEAWVTDEPWVRDMEILGNPNDFDETWYVLVAKWYGGDAVEADNRTGVRAFLFERDGFPFDDFTVGRYDENWFDIDAIATLDSASGMFVDNDGSHYIPHEPGRIGFRNLQYVQLHLQDMRLFWRDGANRPV